MSRTFSRFTITLLAAFCALLPNACNTPTAEVAQRAANGDSWAQFEYGRRLLTGTQVQKDEAKALIWFHASASQGNPRAMTAIGYCHERGLGTPVDAGQARSWYQRAASTGDNHALAALARFDMLNGRSAEALASMDKLSQQRDPKATRYLIKRYMDPASPDYNPAKGVDYLRYAALDGSEEAAQALAYCYQHGIGVPRNPQLAAGWKKWIPEEEEE